MLVISVSAGGVFFSVRVGYKERNEESCTASLGFSLVGLNTLKLESELVLLIAEGGDYLFTADEASLCVFRTPKEMCACGLDGSCCGLQET